MTLERPRPPHYLHGVDAVFSTPRFESARDLLEWLTSTFIDDAGALHNPDHSHLAMASIGCLWTNVANARNGRRIVGQAEFKPPAGTMGKWARARAESQILEWFGQKPEFMLTFDAEYAASCSDIEFCALVEHELYHCGQEQDEFGMPKFSRAGVPVYALRGHDIEEFSGVVKRYGAYSPALQAFIAGAQAADVPAEHISKVCGTCSAR